MKKRAACGTCGGTYQVSSDGHGYDAHRRTKQHGDAERARQQLDREDQKECSKHGLVRMPHGIASPATRAGLHVLPSKRYRIDRLIPAWAQALCVARFDWLITGPKTGPLVRAARAEQTRAVVRLLKHAATYPAFREDIDVALRLGGRDGVLALAQSLTKRGLRT